VGVRLSRVPLQQETGFVQACGIHLESREEGVEEVEVIIKHSDGAKDVYRATTGHGWYWEEYGAPHEGSAKIESSGEVHTASATEHVLQALVKLVGTDPTGGYTS
jgi:hypothetical protein